MSKSDKQTNKLTSFTKLSLLISTKTPKMIKEISKFFKKSSQLTEKKNSNKSYTQALFSKTSKISKIKEMFLKLQVKKIKNIHKIINGESKSKVHLEASHYFYE